MPAGRAECKEGILYYRSTKQRVRLEITSEIEKWALEIVAKARECAKGQRPAPLVASPKCVRCSLAPVCLPDETNFLRQLGPETSEENGSDLAAKAGARASYNGRRSLTPRDERRALYPELTRPFLSAGKGKY